MSNALVCGTCKHYVKDPAEAPTLTPTYVCIEGPPGLVMTGMQQTPAGLQVQMTVRYTPLLERYPACHRHEAKATSDKPVSPILSAIKGGR